jgi:DNA-binding MltR family transcriptional regulator
MNESDRVYLELDNESDRASAVLCAAFLDHELEVLLRRFMRDIKETNELFQQMQPLSTFSSKIKFAYVLGLISHEVYHDLNLIRRIRNDFAHDRRARSFTETEIASRCLSLKLPVLLGHHPSKEPRARFESATKMILGAVYASQTYAHAEKRVPFGENPVDVNTKTFSHNEVEMTTWFYRNEKLAGLTLTYTDRTPVAITWDDSEALLRLANELRILVSWMKPETQSAESEVDAG